MSSSNSGKTSCLMRVMPSAPATKIMSIRRLAATGLFAIHAMGPVVFTERLQSQSPVRALDRQGNALTTSSSPGWMPSEMMRVSVSPPAIATVLAVSLPSSFSHTRSPSWKCRAGNAHHRLAVRPSKTTST